MWHYFYLFFFIKKDNARKREGEDGGAGDYAGAGTATIGCHW